MSKPNKYNPETISKLLVAIRGGRTVKDACLLANISDMTLTRWWRQHPVLMRII